MFFLKINLKVINPLTVTILLLNPNLVMTNYISLETSKTPK